jgi:hypothetical protein
MRGGRTRWKIANETCNTLKNQGYNFAHNDGHGEQHLSVVFTMVDNAGVFGRPNATAVLCFVPSRLDKTRQQAAVAGAHAGVVL